MLLYFGGITQLLALHAAGDSFKYTSHASDTTTFWHMTKVYICSCLELCTMHLKLIPCSTHSVLMADLSIYHIVTYVREITCQTQWLTAVLGYISHEIMKSIRCTIDAWCIQNKLFKMQNVSSAMHHVFIPCLFLRLVTRLLPPFHTTGFRSYCQFCDP
jgi:hypothetical protein